MRDCVIVMQLSNIFKIRKNLDPSWSSPVCPRTKCDWDIKNPVQSETRTETISEYEKWQAHDKGNGHFYSFMQ